MAKDNNKNGKNNWDAKTPVVLLKEFGRDDTLREPSPDFKTEPKLDKDDAREDTLKTLPPNFTGTQRVSPDSYRHNTVKVRTLEKPKSARAPYAIAGVGVLALAAVFAPAICRQDKPKAPAPVAGTPAPPPPANDPSAAPVAAPVDAGVPDAGAQAVKPAAKPARKPARHARPLRSLHKDSAAADLPRAQAPRDFAVPPPVVPGPGLGENPVVAPPTGDCAGTTWKRTGDAVEIAFERGNTKGYALIGEFSQSTRTRSSGGGARASASIERNDDSTTVRLSADGVNFCNYTLTFAPR